MFLNKEIFLGGCENSSPWGSTGNLRRHGESPCAEGARSGEIRFVKVANCEVGPVRVGQKLFPQKRTQPAVAPTEKQTVTSGLVAKPAWRRSVQGRSRARTGIVEIPCHCSDPARPSDQRTLLWEREMSPSSAEQIRSGANASLNKYRCCSQLHSPDSKLG